MQIKPAVCPAFGSKDFEKLLGNVGIGDAPGDDDGAVLPGILHFRQGHGGFGQEPPGFGGVQDDQSGHFLFVRAGIGNSDFVEHKTSRNKLVKAKAKGNKFALCGLGLQAFSKPVTWNLQLKTFFYLITGNRSRQIRID
ncbi:MAG: hypothetical protein EHM27_18510 [Deltaproteobacteria bacterium]|nr:MAG: hypothetical protein EHM27_18510 [Deltaproteobacteria bacterium]